MEKDTSAGGGPVEDTVEKLTDEAQALANAAIDGIQTVGNHGFDVGQAAAGDMLRVVDELVTRASTLQSLVVGSVIGDKKIVEDAQAVPAGGPVEITFTRLSDEAQQGANQAINAIQALGNSAVDTAQGAAEPWLHLTDTLITRISSLQSSVIGSVSGKLGGSQ